MSTTAGERFERLTVLQVHAKITDGWRPMWVDVRKPHEWAQGTIERAEHFIPHDTVIANGLPGVPLDTPVLLQCRS
ncbi:MAG TPA: hypothetical protein DFR83_24845, partial [Deltaproteobacteria bacterium]|nr:hypothetical protein [Deltaproteobacteria bacterium]